MSQSKLRLSTADSESYQRPTEQPDSLRWHHRCHRQATGLKPTLWDQLMSRTSSIMERRQVDCANNFETFDLGLSRFSEPLSITFRRSILARSIGNFPIGVGKYTWDRSIIKALGKFYSVFIVFTSSCDYPLIFSSGSYCETQVY